MRQIILIVGFVFLMAFPAFSQGVLQQEKSSNESSSSDSKEIKLGFPWDTIISIAQQGTKKTKQKEGKVTVRWSNIIEKDRFRYICSYTINIPSMDLSESTYMIIISKDEIDFNSPKKVPIPGSSRAVFRDAGARESYVRYKLLKPKKVVGNTTYNMLIDIDELTAKNIASPWVKDLLK